MTDEKREQREVEETPLEADASGADEEAEPDFELHGQFFEAPSE